MVPESMLSDDRSIKAIYWNGENGGAIAVGMCGVQRIVAYPEAGAMGDMSFLAVYKGDEIWQRVPATAVTVEYEVDDDQA